MKCPFRTLEVKRTIGSGGSTSIEFLDCYGDACPFYGAETHIGSLTVPERCNKAQAEIRRENKK